MAFGVYAAALVKKRRYWHKGVPGDAIDQYFRDKYVTYVDNLEAITEDVPDGPVVSNHGNLQKHRYLP